MDSAQLRIGYVAFCQAVPDCGGSAAARNLPDGLGKVADIVDVLGLNGSRETSCDATLVIDCAIRVREPYFIYLSADSDRVMPADHVIYQRAVGLFAESGCAARSLAEVAGIAREKIHVIAPALATRQDPGIRFPRRMRPAPRRKLLLAVRPQAQRVVPGAWDLVLDALEILRREHDPRVSLTVTGLRDWPLAGPVPDGVRLTGALPAGPLAGLFDAHDLLLVPPGGASEGVPEALSRGVPCVASRTSEMSAAITPGGTGVFSGDGDARELAAAIALVLASDEMYRECYVRAPAMTAYFSWERVARQVAHVISREIGLASLRHANDTSETTRKHQLSIVNLSIVEWLRKP